MVFYKSKKKSALVLFGIGFVIGIFIEITLIESGKLAVLFYNGIGLNVSQTDASTVTCIIFLKNSHSENVLAAGNTWLQKCEEVVAVRVTRAGARSMESNQGESPEVNRLINNSKVCERTRVLNVTASSAWGGLCKVLHFIQNTRSNWFILAPDNLLVLVDNLKTFVSVFDPREGHYYGHAIRHFEANYNVFSAGVLISRGTLKRLLDKFNSPDDCHASGKHWRNEDLYLGKYLKQMDILPKDTRDEYGRGRFHGYNIYVLSSPGKLFNQSDYRKKALYPVPTGLNCCSSNLITIDATNSHRMYHHYYFIYGINNPPKQHKTTKKAEKDDSVWKEFLKSEGYNDTAINNITGEEYYKIWAKKIPPESLYERMRKEFGS